MVQRGVSPPRRSWSAWRVMLSMRAARSEWPALRWVWVAVSGSMRLAVSLSARASVRRARGAGLGGEISEGGDLAGELAQVGGVGAGPGGEGAVGGAAVAGGLYALFAGGVGGSWAYAQVAPFCGLAAGDAQGVGEVGPAGACRACCLDESGFPPRELFA